MMLTLFLLNGVFRVIGINRMRYFLLAMPFFVIVLAHLLLSFRRWRVIAVLCSCWSGRRAGIAFISWPSAGPTAATIRLLMEHPPLQQFSDALRGAAPARRIMCWLCAVADDQLGAEARMDHGRYYTQVGLGIDGGFVNARLRGEELEQDIVDRLDNQSRFDICLRSPRQASYL